MTISCAIIAPNYESNYYVVIISFLFVIALAFLTTKWLAKSKFSGTKGQNMKVIERMYLTTDKMLIIVEIGGLHLLMSQDKNGVRLIKELVDFVPSSENTTAVKFSDVFNKIKNNKDK